MEILGGTWACPTQGGYRGGSPVDMGRVPGAGDSRGRGFPRASILPGTFDGEERAGKALERPVMAGK